jgi:hypothetical protein
MPPGNYAANFTSGALVAGFDVLTSSYGQDVRPGSTIQTIPWAASQYAVVVQTKSAYVRRRHYMVAVYLESDYGALRQLVDTTGTLLTPREAIENATLLSVHRADSQDPSTVTGPQKLALTFAMLV